MRFILMQIISLFYFCVSIAAFPADIFLGSREGDPAGLVKNVSTINGDYSEIATDLVVPGPDPLILSRFYSSRDDPAVATFGGWRFLPHCFLILEKNSSQGYTTAEGTFSRTLARVGTTEGSILTFAGWMGSHSNSLFKLAIDGCLFSITNNARGKIQAWTNLKNSILQSDPKNELFELTVCNGGKRFYYKHPKEGLYLLYKEILPSGNRIFYDYTSNANVALIKLLNSKEEKVLSWIKIDYSEGVHIETSDGQTAHYRFNERSFLESVTRSHLPPVTYYYQTAKGHPLLIQESLPEGRIIDIEYSQENPFYVSSITLSEGDSTSFLYGEGFTTIKNSLGRKTVHYYSDDLQLIAVEEYLENSPYRTFKKFWGKKKDACNLMSETIEDGAGQTLFAKTYTYDDKGNLLEEKEYGNLTGANPKPLIIDDEGIPYDGQEWHKKTYAYYIIDGVDVINQIDAKKNGLRFCYKPGTNLLLRKSILERNERRKRWFYHYNDDGALIQTSVDDGGENVEKSLFGVCQRLITTMTLKKEAPFVGAPEEIEEKYLDPKTKQEVFLKKVVNHFDPYGKIFSQDFYDGEQKHLYSLHKTYNDQGLLVLETDPLGNQTRYSYDANHNLTSIETEEVLFECRYDLKNRPIETIQSSSFTSLKTHTTYDPNGNILSTTDPRGNLTEYAYDELGRVSSITFPQIAVEENFFITPKTTYTYDIFDSPTSITDSYGNNTIISYTPRKTPIEVIHPDGSLELFKYDSEGSLHRYCGQDGIIQVFEYDYLGRISHIEYYERDATGKRDGFKRKYYTYNAFFLTSEKDEEGYKASYLYDGAGRLKSFTKDAQKVEYFYNPQGRVSEAKTWKSPNDFTLQVKKYDLQGNVIETSVEDSQGNILLKSKNTYDPFGRLIGEIGYPQNKETLLKQYEYDAFGRPTKVIDPFHQIATIQYEDHYTNSQGQKVLKVLETDPLETHVEKVYDVFNRQAKISKKTSQGDLLYASYLFFDAQGNETLQKTQVLFSNLSSKTYSIQKTYTPTSLISHATFGSKTHSYTYNTYGDLSNKIYPEKDPITYEYNQKAELQKISLKDASYTFKFDSRGNQTEVKSGKPTFTLRNQFDANNQPILETIEDEWGSYQVKCSFDGEGHITTIELPDQSLIKYSYQGPFVKTITRLSKEKKEIYQYRVISRDLLGNILEEILPGHVGSRRYSYDKKGRKTAIFSDFFQESIPPNGRDTLLRIIRRDTSLATEKYTHHYSYDLLSQLTLEKGPFGNNYAYDSIGNRLEKNGEAYRISDCNELLEGPGVSCLYDPSGNLISKSRTYGTLDLQYNGLNQLTLVESPGGCQTLFTYDAHGKRLLKTLKKQNSKQKVSRFFYVGKVEIGSLNEKGEISELKVPIDPNTLSLSAAFEIENEPYIPLYDLVGNVACLIDPEKRTLVESYQYSAFGEEKILNRRGIALKCSSIKNPWRYQNARVDEESHLIYFGTRYYDPEIGRWISPDPAGDLDGPNLYAYCHNNPLTYTDPFGLAAQANELKVNRSYFYGEVEPHCHCETHRTCKRGGDIGFQLGSSSWGGSLYHHSMEILDHPRVQGGLEAFGGLTEAMIGGGVALGSGGLAAPFGGLILAHGLDHFFTGVQTAFSGNFRESVTTQLLQKTGMSSQTSSLVDGGLSIAGSIGGLGVIRASQEGAFSSFSLPRGLSNISGHLSNPLQETKYTRKTLLQMEKNLKTGLPDFHGFPRIVDNYARFGKKEFIQGKDGVRRTKISLEGGYQGHDGYFEWIIEANQSINHRIFISNP